MEETTRTKETVVKTDPMPDPAEEHRVTPPDTRVTETETKRTVDTETDND